MRSLNRELREANHLRFAGRVGEVLKGGFRQACFGSGTMLRGFYSTISFCNAAHILKSNRSWLLDGLLEDSSVRRASCFEGENDW